MPFDAYTRSEMFYLAGLLYGKRGEGKRSRELLRMCVKEDPTLRWPAFCAKRKMAEGDGA